MGLTNNIAVRLKLMSREELVEVMSIQAKFFALFEKGVERTERFLDNEPLFPEVRDNWDALAQKHDITQNDFLYSLTEVSKGDGLKNNEAPAVGEIANNLGYISKPTQKALLTGQAAVRAEDQLNSLSKADKKPLSAESIKGKHGRIDYEGKFDPPQLVAAQINNKAADELHLSIKSGEVTLEDSANDIAEIKAATKQAYKDAAAMFKELEVPGASLVAQEFERASNAVEKQK